MVGSAMPAGREAVEVALGGVDEERGLVLLCPDVRVVGSDGGVADAADGEGRGGFEVFAGTAEVEEVVRGVSAEDGGAVPAAEAEEAAEVEGGAGGGCGWG
jgi:hypothetical protein